MLKTIKLYGDLREITGHSELDAHVNSVGDSIRFLLMNWPQLEAHMNTQHYQVFTDGNEIEENQIHYPVAEEIKIVPVIAGAGGGTGKMLAGAALIGLAIVFAPAAAAGGGFLTAGAKGTVMSAMGLATVAAGNIGIGLVLSGVSQLLFPVPKPEKFENDQDPRISFDFGGAPNTSRAGTTHPIVYGEIFTGSTVISMNLTTDQVTA